MFGYWGGPFGSASLAYASVSMINPSASDPMGLKSENNATCSVASLVLFAVSCSTFLCRGRDHVMYQLHGLLWRGHWLASLFSGQGGLARALAPNVTCHFWDSCPVGFIVVPVIPVRDHYHWSLTRSCDLQCLLLMNEIVEVATVQPREASLKPLNGFSLMPFWLMDPLDSLATSCCCLISL